MLSDILSSYWLLASLFFIVSLAYSSVGLGGGSSYTALLILLGFSSVTVPILSLSFNLLVTTIGSFNFIRQKHLKLKLLVPFVITSMPMAWFGGMLQTDKYVFQLLLFVSLILIAFRIYF